MLYLLSPAKTLDYDTPLPEAVGVAKRIMAAARAHGLPCAIETHRDTFTETPEAIAAATINAATAMTISSVVASRRSLKRTSGFETKGENIEC